MLVITSDQLKEADNAINVASKKLQKIFKTPVRIKFMFTQANIDVDTSEDLTPKVEKIISIVAEQCTVSVDDIKSLSRKTDHCTGRFICYKIIKDDLDLTLLEIGKFFSNRDHSSIIHGIKTFDNYYFTDARFRNKFDQIQQEIKFELDHIK